MRLSKFFPVFFSFVLFTTLNAYCEISDSLKTVRVGIYQYKPLIDFENSKQPTGLFIDLLQDIAKKNNWKIIYTKGSWQDNLNMLKTGKIDLVLGIVMNKNRAEEFNITKEPVISSWVQIYAKDNASKNTILDLDKKTIVGLSGNAYLKAFKESVQNFNIHPIFIEKENIDDVFRTVKESGADYAVSERIAGLSYKDKYNLYETPIMLAPNGVGFGTTKGKNNDLIASIDQYLIS